MSSRRGRSRRGWSLARLYGRLRRKRSRVAWGAALLFGAWLLWPQTDHGRDHRWQSRERQTVAGIGAGGLVATAPPSVAVSARRELAGMAVAVHGPIEQRLSQVARTMPEIGIPEALAREAIGIVLRADDRFFLK